MRETVFKRSLPASVLIGLAPLFFTAAMVAIIFIGVNYTRTANEAEGIRLLEEALMRVAVHSYAVNGFFPESLDYIVENFGVFIDHGRFVVHYEVFAANLLPDIRVFALR